MKSKNFRVGNIIDVFGQCEIIAIGRKKITVKSETKTGYLIEKCPIDSFALEVFSLSETWLKQLNCPDNFISKDAGGYFIWFNGEKIYIKYVHELQNLYFALRGNELELKTEVSSCG